MLGARFSSLLARKQQQMLERQEQKRQQLEQLEQKRQQLEQQLEQERQREQLLEQELLLFYRKQPRQRQR